RNPCFEPMRWVSQELNPSCGVLLSQSGLLPTPSSRFRAIRREQVAGPAHRADDRGPGRIGLDLLADAGDAHVDGAIEGFAVARLGEVEEPLAREHALGVLGECLEQGKLGACERVLVAALIAQYARLDVEPFGAEPDWRPAGRHGSRCSRG